MGQIVSSFIQKLFAKKEMRILIVGGYHPGKTTILYKLKLNEIDITIPTIGYNVEMIKYKNYYLSFWDIGYGGGRLDILWKNYFYGTDKDIPSGIIYVVDCANREDIVYSREGIVTLTNGRDFEGVPILVFANKQDVTNAMSVDEVKEKLNLDVAFVGRPWHVQASSAIRGDGLYEGLDWLINEFEKKKQLSFII
ncbi:hypothetical protein HCN44_009145 [Aphidius gifuensis]|uniref:ADP-ribosylation factor n=1 Tax=Aphidius gifuensis TaxID=684658 RepID=A0A834Y6R6_APHGI|nr:ADP-ribosylation factor 4-like [Aphidius gifuensis]KAF7997747.1 hypothetical protein HCN44_009145 [Aphidius gifuensis]